jgi:hypothetical protein
MFHLLIMSIALAESSAHVFTNCGFDCACDQNIMYCGDKALTVPPFNVTKTFEQITLAIINNNCDFKLNTNGSMFPQLQIVQTKPMCNKCIVGDFINKYIAIGFVKCTNGL